MRTFGIVALCVILIASICNNIKRTGNWDKVTILDGGYWKNFERIVNDVKEIIENGKN